MKLSFEQFVKVHIDLRVASLNDKPVHSELMTNISSPQIRQFISSTPLMHSRIIVWKLSAHSHPSVMLYAQLWHDRKDNGHNSLPDSDNRRNAARPSSRTVSPLINVRLVTLV